MASVLQSKKAATGNIAVYYDVGDYTQHNR